MESELDFLIRHQDSEQAAHDIQMEVYDRRIKELGGRPDYEAKPEIVECEVFKNDITGWHEYRRNSDSDTPFRIHIAVSAPDFIGFKYDYEKLHDLLYPNNAIRLYIDEDGNAYSKYREGYEVLTPTHVLFKGRCND